ncbi:MAG TPA: hypothetical protein VNK04_09815 [Gemmataceae bacterium]|nr:hypothetical protein [Gemmataceae bacterium]
MFWRKKSEPLPLVSPVEAAPPPKGQGTGPLPLVTPGAALPPPPAPRSGPLPLIPPCDMPPPAEGRKSAPLPLVRPDATAVPPAPEKRPGPLPLITPGAGDVPPPQKKTGPLPLINPVEAPPEPTTKQGGALPLLIPVGPLVPLPSPVTKRPPIPLTVREAVIPGAPADGTALSLPGQAASETSAAERTWRLLVGSAVLLLLAVLVGGGMHFLMVVQPRQKAAALLQRLEQAEQAGDTATLTRCLDEYLTLAPDNTESLARYALALDRHTQSPADQVTVIRVLEHVLRRDPERPDLRRRLITLRMEVKQFTEALEDLEVLLQAFPENAELEHLAGRCEQGRGNHAKAEEWFRKAAEHAAASADGRR